MDKISTFKLLGIPDGFFVVLLLFLFILLISPYFAGINFGIFQVPNFPSKWNKNLKLIMPFIFVFSLMLCMPYWQEGQNKSIKSFDKGTFGILVAGFKGRTEKQIDKGKAVQGDIASTLKARFQELEIHDTEVKVIPTSVVPFLETHESARKLGEKYHASLVIWGDITSISTIPYLTLVNPTSELSMIIKPETVLLKDELIHRNLDAIEDINLPPLTEETFSLVSFVVGLRFYYQYEYKSALKYFDKSLPKNPSEYIHADTILLYMGNAQFYLQIYDKAIADYNKALEINPKHVWAYNNRGNAYSAKGDIDKAIADYNKVLEINPKYFGAYSNRGNAYSEKGDIDKAIADYNKAIEINPKCVEAYNNRGNAYSEKGDIDKAIADYNKALEINPKLAVTWFNIACYYSLKKDKEKVLTHLSEATALDEKIKDAANTDEDFKWLWEDPDFRKLIK